MNLMQPNEARRPDDGPEHEEPFRLVNPRPRVRPSIENNTARQRMLLAGLDCLPGQGDLFATDGELADEPAATPPNPPNPSTGENP